jgi:uncharacterized protein YndB with AHSA1/START domain
MEREITITRRLAAPRTLVFAAFTQAEHLARWWGPHGFQTRVAALDVRPGGAYDLIMRGPDGADYPMQAVFEEVAPPERLSFRFTADSKAGVRALEGVTTVSLSDKDGQTELVLTAKAKGLIPEAAFMLAGMHEGWSQSLDRLAALDLSGAAELDPSLPTFTITRTFDAPRELIFTLYSDAEHLARWWGPAGWEMKKGDLDFRPGGHFHYLLVMPTGAEMWGMFRYKTIVPNERIVSINGFSDPEGGVTRHPMAPTWPLQMLTIMTLVSEGERTRLTLRAQAYEANPLEQQTFHAGFASMNGGFSGTLDQLAAYIGEIKAHGG